MTKRFAIELDYEPSQTTWIISDEQFEALLACIANGAVVVSTKGPRPTIRVRALKLHEAAKGELL